MNQNYPSLEKLLGRLTKKNVKRGRGGEKHVRFFFSFFLMSMFFVPLSGNAQFVQIGTGTTTTTNLPIVSCWGYTYSQQIYTAAQVGQSGNIERISFFYHSGGTTISNWDNWTVYIGHTNKTSFDSTTDWIPVGTLTQVFSGTVTPVAGNWMHINLVTPFAYNGVDNLVVAIDENAPDYSCSASWYSFSSGTNTGIYFRSDTDNPDPATPPTATSRTGTLAQMQIIFESTDPPACVGGMLPADNATGIARNASLNWDLNGLADSYDLYLGTTSPPALVGNFTGTTYTPPVLFDSNTTYYWQVVPKNTFGDAVGCAIQSFTTGSLLSYCSASATSASDSSIGNVSIGSIDNTSTTGMYQNFTGTVAPATLVAGNSYPASVTYIATGSNSYASFVNIFIDFNQDGIFDISERFALGNTSGFNTVTGLVEVPVGALEGPTMMRVVLRESGSVGNTGPCGTFTWGEVEDYLVTIVMPPDTPPAPVQSADTPDCTNGTELTVAAPTDPNVTYYWQTTANGTSMDFSGSAPYVAYLNGTYYVRAYDDDIEAWSIESSSIVVSNIPTAPLPPTPVADESPACLSTFITVPASSDPNVSYYWQGTNVDGTSNAVPASAPFEVTASGTYYVSAFDASTNCWSETSGVMVEINTFIPNEPEAAVEEIDACINVSSVLVEANLSTETYTHTVVLSPAFNLGGNSNTTLNGTLDLPDGATIMSSQLTFNNFSTAGGTWLSDVTIAMTGDVTLPSGTMGGNSGATNQTLNYTPTATAEGAFSLAINNSWSGAIQASSVVLSVQYTVPATIRWFDAPVGGNLLGTGETLEAIGSLVIPDASIEGTYMFYAESFFDTCASDERVSVAVTLTAVRATLTSIDASCNGVADGSFALGTVECGLEPFTYSLDNGVTFGNIPSNLAAGTYEVIIKDADNNESLPIVLEVNEPELIIYAPTGQGTEVCLGSDEAIVEATTTLSTVLQFTETFSFGNNLECYGPAVTFPITIPALPEGAVVTSTTLNITNAATVGGSWRSEMRVALSGAITLPATQLSTLGSSGVITPDPVITVGNLPVNGGTVTLTLSESYDDGGATVLDAIYGNVSLIVHYEIPQLGDVSWWDAPSGGTQLGTGGAFDVLGTSVMPNANTAGTFTVYAQGEEGDCSSLSRTPIVITVFQAPAPTGLPIHQFCPTGEATVGDLMATGTEVQWYASPTADTPLTDDTPLMTGYYFASQTINGCESPERLAVFAFGNATPNPISNPLQQYCAGSTVADLFASGSDLQWYDQISEGNLLDGETELMTGYYYVSQTVNGCESLRTAVAVVINETPAPEVVDLTFCHEAIVADLTAFGENLQWYVSIVTEEPMEPSDEIVSGTYYVSQIIDGCEGIRVMVNVEIIEVEAPGIEMIQVIEIESTDVATIEDLDTTGSIGEVVWFMTEEDALAGTNPMAPGTPILDGETYYAVQIVGGCISTPTAVEVTILLSARGFDMTSLNYYPNPVTDRLQITYNNIITKVEIYNLIGQRVGMIQNQSNAAVISMQALPEGAYMVKVYSNDQTAIIKVVKK